MLRRRSAQGGSSTSVHGVWRPDIVGVCQTVPPLYPKADKAVRRLREASFRKVYAMSTLR